MTTRRGSVASKCSVAACDAGGAALKKTQVVTLREEEQRLGTEKDEKLRGLAGQVLAMAKVFEESKKAHEEQRRLQEERYQELLAKIQSNRDFTQAESKRLTNTVQIVQKKLEGDIDVRCSELSKSIEDASAELWEAIAARKEEEQKLHQELQEEKAERIKGIDDALGSICTGVDEVQKGLDAEKKERVDKNRDIVKQVADVSYSFSKKLEDEKFERELKLQEMQKIADAERDRITRRLLEIAKDADERLKALHIELQRESGERGAAQGSIIDNLSNFIQNFQENI